jgi:AcrR family transcriptional regulator
LRDHIVQVAAMLASDGVGGFTARKVAARTSPPTVYELFGDKADIAHGLYALAQGLAMQEAAGRLGSCGA